MNDLQAHDVMTTNVLVVPRDLPIAAIARLLADRRISAVPVVDAEGLPLGLVTEADLVHRLAARLDKPPSWFASLFEDVAVSADSYSRTHGFVAEEVMTSEIISVAPETSVCEIASLMERHGIRRVLVMEGARIVGLVSRADLLRALTLQPSEGATMSNVPDERIRRAVVAKMRHEPWADTYHTTVEVKDGVVEFRGFSPGPAVQRALRVLAEQVEGVRGVSDLTHPLPEYYTAYI